MSYTIEDAEADAVQIRRYLRNPPDVERSEISPAAQEAINVIVDELHTVWWNKWRE